MALLKVNNVLDLVGNTPLVRLNRMNPNPAVEILLKLEYMNPGGSIKDRAALRMIEAAEESGELTKDKIVLEATSGNTGIGLAMVCAVKGYRMLFALSESASEERKKILRAYGAELLITPAHLSTDGAIEEAYRLAREEPDRYFLVDQFNNDNNWRSHYERGTADEIWEATGHKVDAVVTTIGTSGTLMGLVRRFKELDPKVKVVGMEPYPGHKIQGLKNMKESYAPGIFSPAELEYIVRVDDDGAYETARRLAREEGIFVGMSSGAAVKAALDWTAKMESGVVVAMVPDGGERYLSTSLFVSEKVPEPLRFFNTLSRQVEELHPVRPGKVGIYACGPSLDGPSDLGLCRRMVFADLVRRYLEFRGFDVRLVVNISDIDDRTVSQCLAEGKRLPEFTAHWEDAYFRDMRTLGVAEADHYPKSSLHVGEMIDLTRTLLSRGMAYEKLRSVYFNISKFPEYGKLSGMDLAAVQSGKTVDYDYYEKDNPSDFTLFKRASLAELKAGIYWPTPWGNVRPGWHVECAVMSAGHLGQPFDIHLASTDLIFPHGDNEIAIAEGLTGRPLANMWLHSEVVMAEGKKVNRPAGNVLTLQDLLDQGHSPQAVRYWLLSQHYRRVLRYEAEQLDLAEKTVRRLNDFIQRLHFQTPGSPSPELEDLIHETLALIKDAMDNDLNVPRAAGHLFAFIKKVNSLANARQLDKDQINRVLAFMERVDRVLGVMDGSPVPADSGVEDLIRLRNEARDQGDYAQADAIREELLKMGYELVDTPTGTRWRTV